MKTLIRNLKFVAMAAVAFCAFGAWAALTADFTLQITPTGSGTATFNEEPWSSGEKKTSNPGAGTVVVDATCEDGYEFVGWSVTPTDASFDNPTAENANLSNFSMGGSYTVTATFKKAPAPVVYDYTIYAKEGVLYTNKECTAGMELTDDGVTNHFYYATDHWVMDNLVFTNDQPIAIHYMDVADIRVSGINYVTCGDGSDKGANSAIRFDGSGTNKVNLAKDAVLTVATGDSTGESIGVNVSAKSRGRLAISGEGSLHVFSGASGFSCGIQVSGKEDEEELDTLTIEDSIVTAVAGSSEGYSVGASVLYGKLRVKGDARLEFIASDAPFAYGYMAQQYSLADGVVLKTPGGDPVYFAEDTDLEMYYTCTDPEGTTYATNVVVTYEPPVVPEGNNFTIYAKAGVLYTNEECTAGTELTDTDVTNHFYYATDHWVMDNLNFTNNLPIAIRFEDLANIRVSGTNSVAGGDYDGVAFDYCGIRFYGAGVNEINFDDDAVLTVASGDVDFSTESPMTDVTSYGIGVKAAGGCLSISGAGSLLAFGGYANSSFGLFIVGNQGLDTLTIEDCQVTFAAGPGYNNMSWGVMFGYGEVELKGDARLECIGGDAPLSVGFASEGGMMYPGSVTLADGVVLKTPDGDPLYFNGFMVCTDPEGTKFATNVVMTYALPTPIVAEPIAVANADAKVYTNGFLSTEFEPGKWYAWSNGVATVVYTAKPGYTFEGGATEKTIGLDTMVNPAVNKNGEVPVFAASISYLAPVYKGTDGNPTNGIAYWVTNRIVVTDVTFVTNATSQVTWGTEGVTNWFAVTNNVQINGGVMCPGYVNLILCEGAKLFVTNTANNGAGIATIFGGSFTVYGQPDGAGELVAIAGTYDGAGIGGANNNSDGYNITINGGTVTAIGGYYAAGIGGGGNGNGTNITINAGKVTAIGRMGGACIGGGAGGAGSNITIGNAVVFAGGVAGLYVHRIVLTDMIGNGYGVEDPAESVSISDTAQIFFNMSGVDGLEADSESAAPMPSAFEGYVIMTPMTQSWDRVLVSGLGANAGQALPDTFLLTNAVSGATTNIVVNGDDVLFAGAFCNLLLDDGKLMLTVRPPALDVTQLPDISNGFEIEASTEFPFEISNYAWVEQSQTTLDFHALTNLFAVQKAVTPMYESIVAGQIEGTAIKSTESTFTPAIGNEVALAWYFDAFSEEQFPKGGEFHFTCTQQLAECGGDDQYFTYVSTGELQQDGDNCIFKPVKFYDMLYAIALKNVENPGAPFVISNLTYVIASSELVAEGATMKVFPAEFGVAGNKYFCRMTSTYDIYSYTADSEKFTYELTPVEVTPTVIDNTTFEVFQGGSPVAKTEGKYMVPSNSTVEVVYTAAEGYLFKDGTTEKTSQFVADGTPGTPESVQPAAPEAIWAAEREIDFDTRSHKLILDPKEMLPIAYSTNNWQDDKASSLVVVNVTNANTGAGVEIVATNENGYADWMPLAGAYGRYNFFAIGEDEVTNLFGYVYYTANVELITNGLDVAGTSFKVYVGEDEVLPDENGKYIVETNSSVVVKYEITEDGIYFDDGTKNWQSAPLPADKAITSLADGWKVPEGHEPKAPSIRLGVVAQRYPWNGKVDVNYQIRNWPESDFAAKLEVTADGDPVTTYIDLEGKTGIANGTTTVEMNSGYKGPVKFKAIAFKSEE